MKTRLQFLRTCALMLMAVSFAIVTPQAAFAFDPRGDCTGGCPADLGPGGTLYGNTNDFIYNGALQLTMQSDGNLVIYQSGTAIWATGTNNYLAGASYRATLQTDGNFVVYCQGGYDNMCGTTGTAIWASNTNGEAVDHLHLSTDQNTYIGGNFLLITPSNQDLKQSCNSYHTDRALNTGPMVGQGDSCYPPAGS